MEKKILDLELADSKNANEFSNSVRVLPAHGGNAFPERLRLLPDSNGCTS